MEEAEKDSAKSIAEFVKKVFEKIDHSFEIGGECPNVFWFRGESCDHKEKSLVPSAYREIITEDINDDDYKINERNKRFDFERKALPYISSKNIENTNWNKYFLMQHYKIDTRLLDWTENAIKALFFAIKDDDTNDAKVWILEPFSLNNFTIGKILNDNRNRYVIPPLSEDLVKRIDLLDEENNLSLTELTRRYLTMDFDKEKNTKSYYPLAIYPPFLDERMAAQKACFTIFGNERKGLQEVIRLQNEPNANKILDYVIIDGNSKPKILKELQLIGIDDSSIYPDLDGLGISIKRKYKDAYKSIIEYNKVKSCFG